MLRNSMDAYLEMLLMVLDRAGEPHDGAVDATADMAWQAFCNHSHYTVIVRNYMLGQYRIQLCDSRQPDPHAPPMHGSIVQELCTYKLTKAEEVTDALCLAYEPLKKARGYATETNCEGPGMRIRLDDKPDDHPAGFRRDR